MKKGIESVRATEPISSVPSRPSLPLSFAQERLWFLHQREVGKPVYNLARAYRLTGPLDAAILARCLDILVRRHESLRTAFPMLGDQPVQSIAPDFAPALQTIELESQPGRVRKAQTARLIRTEASHRFDLASGPLLRLTLGRWSPEDHILVLVAHQIIFDGQSLEIFLRELERLYASNGEIERARLAPLMTRYADYALRQREALNGDELSVPLTYWKQQLGGRLPVLDLPADRPRSESQSFNGARHKFTVDQELTGALKKLSRLSSTTLFVTLMTAFKILLHRYTAQTELIVGFPVSSRDREELEHLIGCFVNTLALRRDLNGDPSFGELLVRVRAGIESALAHRDLPFERLVQELTLERDPSRHPVFQAMFAFQNRLPAEINLPGIRAVPIDCDAGTSKFDLTLSLGEREGRLAGFFEYSSDLFDPTTIRRMSRHFRNLLKAIAADPERSISGLALLSAAERRRILVEWNDTATNFPKRRCIHQLFEAQAKKMPGVVAVECAGKRLTYRELNRRANQLARHLRRLGVGAGQLVGVCVGRSLEMVISLLGILKAGAAYLPLDPAYPKERLGFMLEDAHVSVLITAKKVVDIGARNRADHGAQTAFIPATIRAVRIDDDWRVIARQSSRNLGNRVKSNDLAYVLYTSGSTGHPKGVAIEHRNAVAFLRWVKGVFNADELAGVLASTSICFDLSVFELFAPLCWGGTTIVVENALALDDTATAGKVTLINMVPSAASELLAARGLPATVRTVNLAGERLTQDLVRRIYDTGTVGKVYDLYGPTETTTYSTFALRGRDGRETIGRPIANTRVYLLDGSRQPVPVGAVGELFIGGAGVTRGYLRRPQLTAEKFLSDPFAPNSSARMYRTGDLARYLPNGDIELLGRADDQVKIRGHRVELGEIEAMLNCHPGIRESVVVARADMGDGRAHGANVDSQARVPDQQLVAYFVGAGLRVPDHVELRNFLRRSLPAFMLPARYLAVESLPRNPNGKIDRRALPLPADRGTPAQPSISPRGEIEELVAQIWRQVLGRDDIGARDDFFDLGGHSLLASRVASRLSAHFGIEVPLRKLFELPTVEGLAAYVYEQRGARGETLRAPITHRPRDDALPLSSAQQRLWFLQKLDPELSAYNIPSAYRIHGPLDVRALRAALNQIVERHEVLRTAVFESRGQPAQRIVPEARLPLPVIDLTQSFAETADPAVSRLFERDARLPFDLTTAPLMRASLLRLGAEEHVLLLTFHHLVADATSLANFYRELALCYEAATNGSMPSLPPLAVQFADYASWQQNWLGTKAAGFQMDYWKRQLGVLSAPLDLAADFERPATPTYCGRRVTQKLSPDLTRSLQWLARREGATLFMTLLAALSVLLGRLSGRDDIVVGSTIAGHNRAELDGVIGFFINAMALRCDLSGGPSFIELVKRVRAVCLDAYTNQELPFDKVVEAVNPERMVGRNPLFQVMLNMNETFERKLELKNCRVEKIVRAEPAAKFDIVLYAPEVDGTIELSMVYNAELFEAQRVAIYLEHLCSILEQAVNAPESSIERYTLANSSVRGLLPDPAAPLSDRWDGPVHELISQRARRYPQRLAVADAAENWLYRELDRQSSQLANCLGSNGVRPGDVVAIYAKRKGSLIVALLGALKAGAIFVLLDPAYPAKRLVEYLRIAKPRAWLHLDGVEQLPEELANFLCALDLRCRLQLPATKRDIAERLKEYAATAPMPVFSPDNPAYIAFTSGSTGQPKGVLCRHGPMSHFLAWQEKAFALQSSDRYCLVSGLGYNHLQREVFTALSSGATLYIPIEEEVKSPVKLTAWLRDRDISIIHLTPALGRMIQTAVASPLRSLRRLFFGGDLLTRADLAAMSALAPNARMVSFYGATETQRAVGYFAAQASELTARRGEKSRLPTGKGVPDVQLLLLTPGDNLAGVGELAELYVRSPHLAAGYVDDQQLSARNFLVNPFTHQERDRLYRTGDLGRYRPDGNVEWAGRRDRRVNVRGFRVELAEVEAALMQHPAVSAATVINHGEGNLTAAIANSRLVAYVALHEPGKDWRINLERHLAERLPYYMVPSEFILLEHLPLNPNGKVDYASLPGPNLGSAASRPFEAPRTALEKFLAESFSQMLGIERVGRRDDFFHLGGHSLLAARLVARIRQELGTDVDLRRVFEAPTVEALAKRLEEKSPSWSDQPAGEFEREEIEL